MNARACALMILAACGGAPVAPPASQEVAVASVPSASASACPDGTRRESGLCVGKAEPAPRAQPRAQARTWKRPTPLDPPDIALARRRFTEGAKLFDEGDYAAALSSFEGAYAASAAVQVLYNIGMCLERLSRWEEAIDAYETYLAEAPSPRDEARQRLDAIKQRVR